VVRDDGFSILNADDPLTWECGMRPKGRSSISPRAVGWRCRTAGPHIAAGGSAVVAQPGVKGEMIAIYDGDHYIPLMWTHEIPATLRRAGAVQCLQRARRAAIGHAMKLKVETIRQALGSFSTTFFQNPGRLNVYDEHPFRVVMDYGHNP
jgi:cyanophycin synthetase